jgi:NADPH:quinone reductase-like Zn-dependent oxidoreductase
LFERLNLLEGDRILVQGGAGAVGTFAVQLAHRTGAYVVSTAAPRNFELVQELGADEVIDYNSDYFTSLAGSLDAVFDVVGGATLERSWALLKPKGQLVTIASESENTSDERTKHAFLLVEPKQRHLLEISSMLQARQLRVVVDAVIPFERAADAYAGILEEIRGQGKVVVEVAHSAQLANAITA